VDSRQGVECQRQEEAGLGATKVGFTNVREPVRRDDGDEERGERQQLRGDRGEESDQREIECVQGAIAGELWTDPPREY
jgi:hypothetical protein